MSHLLGLGPHRTSWKCHKQLPGRTAFPNVNNIYIYIYTYMHDSYYNRLSLTVNTSINIIATTVIIGIIITDISATVRNIWYR